MNSKRVLGVIPARLKSTRLDRKVLEPIEGMSLLERVYRQAQKTKSLSRLVIATDSEEIFAIARTFPAEVVMTSESLQNGSERVAAASAILGERFDAIVNIQGDMPFVHPELIDGCVRFFLETSERFDMCTVATPIFDESVYLSSSDVKVVMGEEGRALYFSRAPIPFSRDGVRPTSRNSAFQANTLFGWKHLGLYVYSQRGLQEYQNSHLTELEEIERLEQLRLLARGLRIGVLEVDPRLTSDGVEVDTAADLEKARVLARRQVGS